MVVSNPLGPGKFYGSSLPRPQIYTDVKFNSERVDPPARFIDPLLSWAREAHWSMGGLSFNRLRLQGRIEGSVKRLRTQRECQIRNRTPVTGGKSSGKSPPAAPVATKRRRFIALIDEEEEEEVKVVEVRERKRLARRLGDDFDLVADKSPVKSDVAVGRKRLKKVAEKSPVKDDVAERGPAGTRISPRLAKRV